ncbi:hypothetical protein TNCT_607261 [Trichonephila clavata]|uniref:Uncharacterized protein n=1 Tax=Trichonephila clavata TaxID=2740835 RepID=A0A8X6K0D2_TRICU|nr:hypothetical protein TNCT_607261 [Trichonephila clavata]
MLVCSEFISGTQSPILHFPLASVMLIYTQFPGAAIWENSWSGWNPFPGISGEEIRECPARMVGLRLRHFVVMAVEIFKVRRGVRTGWRILVID